MNETEKRVRAKNEEDVLGVINEHPLHSEQIAWQLHISAGEVNTAVLSLRSRGYLICGDDAYDGYYYGSLDLVARTLEQLKEERRLLSMAIEFMERSISKEKEKRAEEQQSIWSSGGAK